MLKIASGDLLRCCLPLCRSNCLVSTKYEILKPRPYRRRLFEAALLPVVLKSNNDRPSWRERQEGQWRERNEYTPMELAYVKHIREWIVSEGFRMIAICQLLPVKGRAECLAKNQFRLNGLEFRQLGRRTMEKLLEGTCLESLSVVFQSLHNCYLFGRDLESIRSVIRECKRYSWIEPLAIAFDTRILSVKEAEKLCEMSSFEQLRLETLSILEGFNCQSLSSLSHPSSCLSNALTYLSPSERTQQ